MLNRKVMKDTIDRYDKDYFITLAMEECAELVQALNKHRRHCDKLDAINEEVADVLICIRYLIKLGVVSPRNVYKMIQFKVNRQDERNHSKQKV